MVAQVARDLLHPSAAGFVTHPRDLDSTGGKVHHEEHVIPDQTGQCEDFDGEEIAGRNRAPVRSEKRAPGHATMRRRLDAMVLEDPLDRIAGDEVPDMAQRTDDSGVSPAIVFSSHCHDQRFDVLVGPGASDRAILAAVVLVCDQPLVPALKGIWRNERSDLLEQFAGYHSSAPTHLNAERTRFVDSNKCGQILC